MVTMRRDVAGKLDLTTLEILVIITLAFVLFKT